MLRKQVDEGIELNGNPEELGEAIYMILTGKGAKRENE